MIRDFKLLLLGSCCLAVTACAAPNREPDLSNIKSNVDQTREGDFGDFLYNLVEAEDKHYARVKVLETVCEQLERAL